MGKRIDEALAQRAFAAVNDGERFDEIGSRLQIEPTVLANALVATRRRQSVREVRVPADPQRTHIRELVAQRHWSWARACEPYGVDPEQEEQLNCATSLPADPYPQVAARIVNLASRHYARLIPAERAELDRALVPEGLRNSADGHLTVPTDSGEVVLWRADLEPDTLALIGAAFFPGVTTRSALVEITTQILGEASKPVNRGLRRGKASTQQRKRAIAALGESPVLEEQVVRLLAWIRGIRALWKQLYPNGSRSEHGSLLDENRVPVWVSGIAPAKLKVVAKRFFAGVADPRERLVIAEAVVRAVYENPAKGSTAEKTLNRRVNQAVASAKREDLRDSIRMMIRWLANGGPEA